MFLEYIINNMLYMYEIANAPNIKFIFWLEETVTVGPLIVQVKG